jgi:hypothetical protein
VADASARTSSISVARWHPIEYIHQHRRCVVTNLRSRIDRYRMVGDSPDGPVLRLVTPPKLKAVALPGPAHQPTPPTKHNQTRI